VNTESIMCNHVFSSKSSSHVMTLRFTNYFTHHSLNVTSFPLALALFYSAVINDPQASLIIFAIIDTIDTHFFFFFRKCLGASQNRSTRNALNESEMRDLRQEQTK
jgi:hypothetical protein